MSWTDDRWRDTYDAWKLASPYDNEPEFKCHACEDQDCPECCETSTVELENLEAEQKAELEAEERRRLEDAAMVEHFRRHPHG